MAVTPPHTSETSGSSPGAILKRCREYHGLTLEEAEEATKIGGNYLSALEEDQIGQFASLAYLKGFLRIYATYLGLNPDDMIRLYERLYESGSSRAGQKSAAGDSGTKAARRKIPLQKLVLPAVLLVLILISASIINRSPAPLNRQNQALPVAVQPPPAAQPIYSSARLGRPARSGDETLSRKPGDDVPSTPQPGTQILPAEGSRGFIVRMKATQGGTAAVSIDGSAPQSHELSVGDSIEWKAVRSITLELSNAGGVEAELNGKQLKPFGPVGKAATVVLDADGVRQ